MSTNIDHYNSLKMQVLSCILHGKDLANTSELIASHTRMSERRVREFVEQLRNEGYLICNEQNGKGYYLAETDEEVERQYRQDCARAMSILRRIKPFRRYLRELDVQRGDQMSFEDMVIEEMLEKGEL